MKTKQMFIGLGVVAALGAAIVPMSTYADVSDTASDAVEVSLKVGGTISMSLDSNAINASVLTSEASTDKTTVATVTTNSTSGYKLSATTSSSDGSLIGTNSASNTLAYVGTNYGSSTEGWALSVGGNYKDIDGNKIDLFTNGSPASNEATTVTYNFKTAGTTTTDTYKTTLTYTAQAQN